MYILFDWFRQAHDSNWMIVARYRLKERETHIHLFGWQIKPPDQRQPHTSLFIVVLDIGFFCNRQHAYSFSYKDLLNVLLYMWIKWMGLEKRPHSLLKSWSKINTLIHTQYTYTNTSSECTIADGVQSLQANRYAGYAGRSCFECASCTMKTIVNL